MARFFFGEEIMGSKNIFRTVVIHKSGRLGAVVRGYRFIERVSASSQMEAEKKDIVVSF